MNGTLVRYRVKPECVEANADLVRQVYAELATRAPSGFRYQTWVGDDGVTFFHLAITEDDGAAAPLTSLPAFKRFQAGLRERCDEPPVVTSLPRRIATYG